MTSKSRVHRGVGSRNSKIKDAVSVDLANDITSGVLTNRFARRMDKQIRKATNRTARINPVDRLEAKRRLAQNKTPASKTDLIDAAIDAVQGPFPIRKVFAR